MDDFTPTDLWQEHHGGPRELVGPTPPVPREAPWFVQHLLSILILLAGVAVWVGHHLW